MKPKSGKAGTAVSPAAPAEVFDSDTADPGEVAEVKAEQVEFGSGKYGSTSERPFKQEEDSTADEKGGSWIEIELVGEDDEPIPGEKYRITLPDGSVAEGTLDDKGFARVEGFESGSCKVTFPMLDKEAWEKI